MSFSEIGLLFGGVAVGVASGSFVIYYSIKRRSASSESVEKNPLVNSESIGTKEEESSPILGDERPRIRIISKAILDKSKRELRTLLLEKELVSAALTRLYEAEAAQEITSEEREILGGKYCDELKTLDERVQKVDAFIEVGDLETLRDQLLQLVNQKMDAIERRIEHTRILAAPLIEEMLNKEGIRPRTEFKLPVKKEGIPNISDLLVPETEARENAPQIAQTIVQPQEEPRIKRRVSDEPKDSQAEQLQRELLEALDRLEKLDVET